MEFSCSTYTDSNRNMFADKGRDESSSLHRDGKEVDATDDVFQLDNQGLCGFKVENKSSIKDEKNFMDVDQPSGLIEQEDKSIKERHTF